MTSLNGLIAEGVVHLVGYYALEQTGVVTGHRIAEDAETI